MSFTSNAAFAAGLKSKTGKKPLFISPAPAGRRITAGFSYVQRIGKTGAVDVWFPDCIKKTVDEVMASGLMPGPEHFPAEWAAVRQFELLQEAGNICIYDLDPTHLMRTIRDITSHMHGGGYRVTVATIGSYGEPGLGDELEILDRNLQTRISTLINMLYLEEQSEKLSAALAENLRQEKWDYQTALPHIGVTLGARDLFRPSSATLPAITVREETAYISIGVPHHVEVAHAAGWIGDLGVTDAVTGKKFARVAENPQQGQYTVSKGIYYFAAPDATRAVLISYRYRPQGDRFGASEGDRRHRLSRHFFEILNMLPQKHILHETAVGLQLPESINENQWIYIARDGEKVGDFVRLMDNLFAPFNKVSLGELHGREGAGPEVKAMVGHMRGYGDRLRPDADQHYRSLARCAMH